MYWWGVGITEIVDHCGFIWLCTCSPFILIGFPLAIICGILCPLGVAFASFICGPTAAVTAYNDGIKASFKFMGQAIVDCNAQYYNFVFGGDFPDKYFFWCDC